MAEGHKPKILIFDVETSTMDLAIKTYQLKNYIKYFNPDDIVRDWILLSVAWKFHGDKTTKCISVHKDNIENDRAVVDAFYNVLKTADVIIGHNMKGFDIKKFNTKIIEYGYAPLHFKAAQIIDTLTLSRRYFKFSSNRLSYVAKKLGVDAKDASPDWNKILDGSESELRYMRKYNKQDVIVTEQVYDKLKGWHDTHINLNMIAQIKDSEGLPVVACRVCLSGNLMRDGFAYNATTKSQRHKCKDCGANTYGKKEKLN